MDLPQESAGPGRGKQAGGLPWTTWLGLGACLFVLVLHVGRYWFLCDDAFISFRYARNLAEGHGLVFNPGFERVEGYSNFLWVLILAGAAILGVRPEDAANPLSVACGLALVWRVVEYCRRRLPAGAATHWVLVPAALLALNRSFAVWCTSGLETKLFELLVVWGVLSAIEQVEDGARNRVPAPALLLALATLTRPDGLLIAGCLLGTMFVCQARRRTAGAKDAVRLLLVFGVPVAAHFAFRRAYYGEWLPNTYYAKVGGQTWWAMGGRYLACFALEYAAVLWLPLLAIAGRALAREGRAATILLVAAVVAPHALYIAAIGGDHFEYRPLDLYLPLVFVLLFHAAASFGRTRGRSAGMAGWLVLCAAGGALLPDLSHRDFPPGYRTGFPGLMPRDGYRDEMIDSLARPWVFSTPGLRRYAILYNDLMSAASRQFVGLRQEEHRSFLATAIQQGRWLEELLRQGVLPADLHLAVDCVGAIPYYSGLRTLDRLGLTDRVVARQPDHDEKFRVMAHAKLARPEYLRDIGVDLDLADRVHAVLPEGHPRLLLFAQQAALGARDYVHARLPDGKHLVATAAQGVEALQRRLPHLRLRPAAELVDSGLRPAGGAFTPVPRERQFGPPYDMMYFDQGLSMVEEGSHAAALVQFQCALATNPDNPMARANEQSLRDWLAQQGTARP
jgi:arabinofuranosyltransferase